MAIGRGDQKLSSMKLHRHLKMPLNASLSALTCVIVSAAAAIVLVCATSQSTNEHHHHHHHQRTQNGQINRTSIPKQALAPYATDPGAPPKAPIEGRRNGTLNSTTGSFGDQAQASLLRPLIGFRHLLGTGNQKGLAAAFRGGGLGAENGEAAEAEEEEEVSKTIMVPMGPGESELGSGAGQQLPSSLDASTVKSNDPMIHYVSGRQMRLANGLPVRATSKKHRQLAATTDSQPNAAASLQLTRAEIGGLLNDREAPEFYREREMTGDGVLLAEERLPTFGSRQSSLSTPTRLGAAASGPFGTMSGEGGYYGNGMGSMSGLESDGAAFYRHNRLSQAASEGAYGAGLSGFNHRFGGAGGESDLGPYGGAGAGGLMQAPNEFSELSSMGTAGRYAGESFGQHHGYGGGAGDYSLQSSLLRAGSEGMYAGDPPSGFMGASGLLDIAAASAYRGGGGEFMGGSSFYGPGEAGQLQAHASYNPYAQSMVAGRFGQMPGDSFGPAGELGDDHRSFASQNNLQVLRASQPNSNLGGGGITQFKPTIPLNDGLQAVGGGGGSQPSSELSHQLEQANVGRRQQLLQLEQREQQMREQFMPKTRATPAQGEVHEAVEEDPTDASEAEEPVTSRHEQIGYEATTAASSDSEEQVSTRSPPGAGGSGAEQQFAQSNGELGAASLVLNVPPPQADRQGTPMSHLVEFSRDSTAGYLGPRSNLLAKKSGPSQEQQRHRPRHHHHNRHRQQAEPGPGEEEETDGEEAGGEESQGAQVGSHEPLNNPAHAGKYIID